MIRSKYIFYLIALTACVEKFNPDLDAADSQPLIVDALLTNENKQHSVTINLAKDISDFSQFTPVIDGTVYVEDSQGRIFDYVHTANDKYTSVVAFAGIIGSSYRLVIDVDGQRYESSFEELMPEAQIAEINANTAVERISSETGEATDELRVTISVDLNLPVDREVYYRFDWNSTYRARTLDQGSTVCWDERNSDPPINLDVSATCYVNESSSSFLRLFSSEGLQATGIEDVAIYSVEPNRRFQTKYSPEITLFHITKTAFDFWQAIENQSTNTGSLFDTPPSPINGNISYTGSGNERVIGIFEVASVTRKRAFFLNSVVNRDFDNYNIDCRPSAGPPGSPQPVRPLFCCDCRFLPNSTDVKPDFWED